jgi:hypothetical protein
MEVMQRAGLATEFLGIPQKEIEAHPNGGKASGNGKVEIVDAEIVDDTTDAGE